MRVEAKAVGIASAIIAGATFVLCALAVAVAPGSTSGLLGWVLHIDLSSMARQVTWGNFIGGLVLFSAFVGLCVGLTAKLYNWLITRQPVQIS